MHWAVLPRRGSRDSGAEPFRDTPLGAERLDHRAQALAARFTVDRRRRARSVLPRFEDNARLLRSAYQTLAADVRAGRFLTTASEWLLDNYHLVSVQIADVRRNLPRAYYRQLPSLAAPRHGHRARIYELAVELIRHGDGRFEQHELTAFLNSYQRVAPLTIGELWAWPSMLTLALVENLRRLADEILGSRRARMMADEHLRNAETGGSRRWPDAAPGAFLVQLLLRLREYGRQTPFLLRDIDDQLEARRTTAEEVVRGEHQRQGVTQVSVVNVITSLRLCSEIDWREFFEDVSLVEQALLRDPSGAYGRMDFLSRDDQRHAVEQIAAPTGEAQLHLARQAVEMATEAGRGPAAGRTGHVGYHLAGAGRRQLEAQVARPPPLRARMRRLLLGHPTWCYLTSIAIVSAAMLGSALVLLQEVSGSVTTAALATGLLMFPALDVATAVVQRLAAWAVPPRRLPRLDFSDGVPADARTMVVVPTMLTSTDAVAALLAHMEVLAHGNLDPHVHFAILSDFADAATAAREDDAPILSAAHEGVQALNLRLGPGHADRVFLFHRDRQWNASERVWMGWERKRGKIEEFNRLLRGATDTSFTTQVGALHVLPDIGTA